MVEGLRHHVTSAQHHHVEHVIDDLRPWTGILHRAERRTSAFIERDELAVDHRLIGQLRQSLQHRWIPGGEIVVVPRPQMELPRPLERDRSIAIELQLIFPLRPVVWQRLGAQEQHRFDEARFRHVQRSLHIPLRWRRWAASRHNAAVADTDKQIDELYHLPLAEFTAARTALAKTLSGDAARQVRTLKKPTAVPAAVNQLYWKARPAYDAAMKAGQALRTAQIATLKGKKADVRAATEAHRKAIASAVHRAVELASDAGLNPNTDQLARMFEALSLAATPPSTPGRFVDVIAPSGFDALAGVTPVTRVHTTAQSGHAIETEHAAPTPKI